MGSDMQGRLEAKQSGGEYVMNSNPGDFWEWAASLPAGERFALLVVALFAFTFLVTIVTGTFYKMHKNRLDVALKRELLERGMNAEEIATVIQAKRN
jgi:hypothetical protein